MARLELASPWYISLRPEHCTTPSQMVTFSAQALTALATRLGPLLLPFPVPLTYRAKIARPLGPLYDYVMHRVQQHCHAGACASLFGSKTYLYADQRTVSLRVLYGVAYIKMAA